MRGGKIQTIPPQPREEIRHTVKTYSTPENRTLSLDDGEFYFAENKKNTETVRQVVLADVVDKFDLPKEIADRLRGK